VRDPFSNLMQRYDEEIAFSKFFRKKIKKMHFYKNLPSKIA